MQLSLFTQTFYTYAITIIPWVLIGTLLSFFLNGHLTKHNVKRYLGSSKNNTILPAVILGMISPLSIMSFLPVAQELIDLGAHAGILFGFLIAERAYDLQSFFIISSLFSVKFALLNFIAIFISLYVAIRSISRDRIVFTREKDGQRNHFWEHQVRIILIVLIGIFISAYLRSIIPQTEFQQLTGNQFGGIAGGLLTGFILYLGPIVANYPIAKAFADLGMSSQGVFAYLTVSPIINIVIILLFGGAVGYKKTLKSFLIYAVCALFMTFIFSPFL